MEKKIIKKNIKKYAAMGILTATLMTGAGLKIHDAHMKRDYDKNVIEDVQISSGKITENVTETYYEMPVAIEKEDGSIAYTVPSGYCLTRDENGNLICQKNVISTQDAGYSLKDTYPENETVLKIRK